MSQAVQQLVFSGLDPGEHDQLTRELSAYCYRLLGSPADAQDAVQDTLLRGWREQDRFEGRSSLRTWLYRIATNVCIDMLRSRRRRRMAMELYPPVPGDGSQVRPDLDDRSFVLPVPDAWLPLDDGDPARRVIARETIRLAFVAVLQRLTARQRAVLILRDVLQFSAAETAEVLGTTVASANSALQRARSALSAAQDRPGEGGPAVPAARAGAASVDQALLAEYVAAFEAYDIARLTSLLRRDAIQSMPPLTMWLRGAAEIGTWMLGPGQGCRGSRLLVTAANGGAAAAQYRSDGHDGHSPWSLHVLEAEDGLISAIHCYVVPELFGLFGFPPAL